MIFADIELSDWLLVPAWVAVVVIVVATYIRGGAWRGDEDDRDF